jgi:hypothetical protein
MSSQSSPRSFTARLCTEILSSGSRCRQFALKGQPFCYAHADPEQRVRNADARELIASIPDMDLFTVALTLVNTLYELRAKLIPPLHAQAIFGAAATRLEDLHDQEVLVNSKQAVATPPANSNHTNRLHAVPMK